MKNSTYVILVCLTIICTGFAQVTEEWVARYDGPASAGDIATAITIDDEGNVYVTGWSYSYETNRDYATVKYDNDGNVLWHQGL